MKKKLLKLAGICAMALTLLVMPAIATQAQDIGLPPSNYNQSGRYPAGKVSNYYYYSTETHSQRKLVVYTPPGYSTDKKYPVVYSIHGIDNTPESIFRSWGAYADIVADNLIGSGQIEPVIIVAWDNNNINCHNELFNSVIPYVEKTFPVIKDADHRAVYGYSMGGGYAFAEVMGNLDTFHHLSPTSALPMNHPSDDAMFKKGSADVKSKLKTLVLSCGTVDWCGFYPSNKATHDYCVQYNIPHYWLSVQGGNHDSGVWGPAMYYLLKYAFPKGSSSQQPTVQPTQQPTQAPTQQAQPAVTGKVNDGWYYIKGVGSQKYLQVTNNNGQAGANVEIGSKSGKDGQMWKVTNLSDGYITLTSKLGNFMIDVAYGSADDNANIGIYNGYSGEAQQFILKETSTKGVYTIATKCSGAQKVLDVASRSTSDGANVCQYKANGQTNQQWIFEAVNGTTPTQTPTTQPTQTPTTQPTQAPTQAPTEAPTQQPTQAPTEAPTTQPTTAPQTSTGKLTLSYNVNSWGSGGQVSFKIENKTTSTVNGWTIKLNKNDVKISSSWNVNIKESGNYYVITPVSWNSTIAPGQAVEFGVLGEGAIKSTIDCSIN